MKNVFTILASLTALSCGTQKATTAGFTPQLTGGMELGECSTAPGGGSLDCVNGVSVPLMPNSPYDCNGCLISTSVVPEGILATAKCPNKTKFSFVVPRGQKGDAGAAGKDGTNGKDGKGDSLSLEGNFIVGRDGNGVFKWSKELPKDAKNGINGEGSTIERVGTKLLVYKISSTGVKTLVETIETLGATGPKGDQGIAGKDGQSCTLGQNAYGQTTITCSGVTKVLSQCTGGCYSFGAKGNVYKLPSNSQGLVPFALLPSPSAVNRVNNFAEFNRQSSLGLWGTTESLTSTPWIATTDFQVEYSGFIEIAPANIALDGTVKFRTTTDDSSEFKLGACLISVVKLPGLNPPTRKEGSLKVAAPGTFGFSLSYMQGPQTQIALALEIFDYTTHAWVVVPRDQLTYVVQ